MRSGRNLSGNPENLGRKELGARFANEERDGGLPEPVRATVVAKPGEYNARRLRSQREVIRDVMLAATDLRHLANAGRVAGFDPLRRGIHFGAAPAFAKNWKTVDTTSPKQRREDTLTAGAWAGWPRRLRVGISDLAHSSDWTGAASSTTAGISQV